jgi:hypothetical protein
VTYDPTLELWIVVSKSGSGNQIFTSPDTITWSTRVTGFAETWRGLTYGYPATLNIRSWDTASSLLTATWKSGKIVAPYPINLGAARIIADTYPVTLNIWDQEGTNVVTDRSVTSDEVIRLPGGYISAWFEIQVSNDDGISMVHVGETVEDVLQG